MRTEGLKKVQEFDIVPCYGFRSGQKYYRCRKINLKKGEKIVTLRSMRERNQQDQVDPKLLQENDFHICLSVTSEDLKYD